MLVLQNNFLETERPQVLTPFPFLLQRTLKPFRFREVSVTHEILSQHLPRPFRKPIPFPRTFCVLSWQQCGAHF